MRRPFTPTRFSARAFVSAVLTLGAVGLPPTGIANHLLQSDPMPGARHAWMSAHNGLAAVFVVFVVWHVALNRRALAASLARTAAGVVVRRRELAWAVLVVGAWTALVVGHALAVP